MQEDNGKPATNERQLEADALTAAEALLLKFGDAIPDPLAVDSHAKLYACLIGIRAKSLYENFLHSLTSPVEIAPILALRPLVEAVILAKWISLAPPLHGELWFAHAEDREVTAMREQEKHLGVRVRADIPTSRITETIEQKIAWRNESVARARAAGKKYGDEPMPSLARLVDEIEEQDPGHRMAMRQAYELAYRGFSPWQHTEATSFKSTATEIDAGVKFLGDVSPYNVELLRLIAGAMFAYMIEIVGVATGDGSEIPARFIRDYLVVVHPLGSADQQPAPNAHPAT
jgi:hypothetical protein